MLLSGSGAQPARARRRMFVLLAMVVLTSAVRLVGIDNDLRGPDEWRETETASIARSFYEDPHANVLWPRVLWGAPGPGFVESELQALPFAVSLLYRVTGAEAWVGRLVAVLLTAASTLLVFAIARRSLRFRWALLAAFAFAASPMVFRYGRAFMPEALALLLSLGAVERVTAFVRHRRLGALAAASAALAAAILVKPTAIHLGLVFAVWLVAAAGPAVLLRPAVLACGLLPLVPALLYFAHAADIHRLYGNTFGVISGGDSKWGGVDDWLRPAFWRELLRLDVVWTVGYAGAALAGIGLCARRRRGSPSWIAWLAVLFVYYAIVARYAGVEHRGLQYHVYAAAPWALAAAHGVQSLTRGPQRRRLQWLALALVLAMVAQQLRADWRHLRDPGRDLFARAGHALAACTAPGEPVVVTSTDVASERGIANNFEEPKILFHAWRHGRLLARDQLDGARLAAALRATGAQCVLVLDEVLDGADPCFRAWLQTAPVVARGPGFAIHRASSAH